MTEKDPVNKGTESAFFLLAQKRSELVFNELLEYATEACLSNPPAYLQPGEMSTYASPEVENQIIQNIGARGLSTVLELKEDIHPLRKEDSGKRFHMSDVVAMADRFSSETNLRVLENAERFGQALIDESFAILGKDAYAWAEKLKRSTSQEEDLEVMDWLDNRIVTIANKSRSESSTEDEEAHFFPPFRISPKFIGTFPNVEIQPSCLSTSIIATSFFERAGKPALHAGVTGPANETGSILLLETLKVVAKKEADSNDPGKEAQSRVLMPLAKASKDWINRPLAQHAAVYTKLSSGWHQFDAYGGATEYLLDEENAHIEQLYTTLNEWRNVLPNLEFSTTVLPNIDMQILSSEFADLSFALTEYEYPDKESLVKKIAVALETIPDESYSYYLYDTCLKPLIDSDTYPVADPEDEEMKLIIRALFEKAEIFQPMSNGSYDSRLFRLFENALREHIRWGDSPEEFIERCRSDPEYRLRRAEDFLRVPAVMAIFNAQLIAQSDKGFSHLAIDIGNPAMRIGLSTLSDFALYDGYPLPASFWTTHWPGAVSVIENLNNPPTSTDDTNLLYNTLLSKIFHPFASSHNYDKISSFLSIHGRYESDDNQG